MSEDDSPAEPDRQTGSIRPRTFLRLIVALIGCLWAFQMTGLVSSNDGSHLALARALALHGTTQIDDEQMLTLMVDRAKRDGHVYSDRPPGTAFAALPAVWLADPLDRRFLDFSLAQMKADPPPQHIEDALLVTPAAPAYLETYGKRRQKVGGPSVNLLALQGTAAVVGLHCIALGLLGLLLVADLLRRFEADIVTRVFAVGSLGLATLWGPYSSALFAHVTAGVGLLGLVYGLARMKEAPSERSAWIWGAVAGLAGAWAVAADYALLVAVVPLAGLLSPPRRWPAVLLGTIPLAAATLAYHDAAFGSPFSIGYDHQTNFEFARERGSTFSGNPLTGLWHLWGAGILLQSPIVLVGLYGVARSEHRRWLYGLLPWMVLLVFHQTPWGGATNDYRYLVPALPLLAVGLGLAWQRHVTPPTPGGRAVAASLLLLSLVSLCLTWVHFWTWRS